MQARIFSDLAQDIQKKFTIPVVPKNVFALIAA